MKKITSILSISLFALLMLSGCKSTTVGSFHSYEPECLGSELDGSETLYVWGTGRNKTDAIEQAKKNAVQVVLFKGITKGASGCSIKPIILEVNAEQKYSYYFNTFFKDGGEYKNYISMEDSKRGSVQSQHNKQQDKYGVVVRVLRSELKNRLISDNILKP